MINTILKKYIAFIFLFGGFASLQAEEQAVFQHYSIDDGLSQNTVMAIMQDSKGFMWFGTWDGLNKFDGYEFTIYKSRPGDHSNIQTNRIDYIHEDNYGFIWIQTYDGKFHRFDPKTEQFYSLPYQTNRFRYGVERSKRIAETSTGDIWIATNEIGALRIVTDPKTFDLKVIEYSVLSANAIDDNHVNFIFEDTNQNIWIGTTQGIQSVNINSNQIKKHKPNGNNSKSGFYSIDETKESIWLGDGNGNVWLFSKDENKFKAIALQNGTRVSDIKAIDNENIIFTTYGNGFYTYSVTDDKLININSSNTKAITSDNFMSVQIDSHNIAWFESEQTGVFRYKPSDKSVKYFQPKVDNVNERSLLPNFIVFEDIKKRLWINPQGGGFSLYNRDKDELEYFYNEPEGVNRHFSNIIHSMYVDRNGNIWLSTYNKGLDKISILPSQFYLGKPNKKENTLTSNEIRSFLQTSDGNIIIATKDGTIRFFNSTLNELGVLSANGALNSGAKTDDLAYCMFEDSRKNIWIGTKGGGLLKLTPDYTNAEKPRYKLKRFTNNPLDNNSLTNDNIYSIIEDNLGNIIIGTFGGGINIVSEIGGQVSFISYKNLLTSYPINTCEKVRHLLQDGNTLWVATANGLLQIDNYMNIGHSREFYIEKLPNVETSLSNNDVHYLHKSSTGELWIGTFGGGLSKLLKKADENSTAVFEHYTSDDGMYSDIVLCIQEDRKGNLWLSSESGLSRFNPKTNFFQKFNLFSGNEQGYFSEAAGFYSKDGNMFFGCNMGYYTFRPDMIELSNDVPSVQFTRFQLFNNDVKIGEKNSPLKQSIGHTEEIKLARKQSVFSIEYAALEYTNPEKISYAFMLEGFENGWNYVQSQRKATYTNIPKGTYHFKVKSTNNEGVWVDNERVLKVKILPSFWETPIAYFIYFILFALALYIVFYMTRMYSRLKNDVVIEQKVTDIKLRFFTNISHELRTPLSLILGPVENILKNEKTSESVKEQLVVVQKNGDRMLRLINQILDFRKIQNKKMRLKIQPTRIDLLIKEICSNFTKEALEKNIRFNFVNESPGTVLWIDRDKTDMIIYNLLSNAFKYTPAGKTIEVRISTINPNGDVQVKVVDEGVGIAREKRLFLFERFTSANEIQSLSSQKGTGIGLNLVKELVDLHKGVIEVESELNKGTTFTVTFRGGKEHFGNDVDYVVEDKLESENDNQETHQGSLDIEHLVLSKDAPLLLVVEDNDEMRNFLTNVLKKDYRVQSASDGEEGWKMAQEIIPDLVISDLMMPNMDGLQFTEKMKNDARTSHIPIILLTAKSAIESRLEAMKYGAEDYITKPFSPVYLEARVENILEQRRRLQETYRKNLLELEPAKVEITSQDEIFLAKLLDIMERNMDNSELTVDDVVSEIGLGRTVFFNKLKGLTGLSPIEFIREIRIKRAAQLLQAGEHNISEITYMVGMSDSRYFSKCFKKIYGMTPSEYKKSLE
ncbi:response regulator [Paludibacter sp. 221]|uniref:hybrid sensor histidine kinase/response regulator transcription factor n=1 Tax=Paludibacter sp. 221 TaxID=2302939 RepID=UPI0013D13B6E|nr:two-component regulator propeller domain-containing protein [Paludibacter sp. 221]NDV46640.1 response regulator [Paludibacter sp. 221]